MNKLFDIVSDVAHLCALYGHNFVTNSRGVTYCTRCGKVVK